MCIFVGRELLSLGRASSSPLGSAIVLLLLGILAMCLRSGKKKLINLVCMDYISHYQSPLGDITMASDGRFLTGLWFDGQKYFGATLGAEHEERDLPLFGQTMEWLDIYFSGRNPDFRPPLLVRGTAFRREVWNLLLAIPYGQTLSYAAMARRMAESRGQSHMSAQAVGGAVGHNPISIIIPCHRVVGADGSLVGYAGGLDRKRSLLHLEQAALVVSPEAEKRR